MKERLLLKQHEVTGFELMLGYVRVLLMLIGGIVLLPLSTLLWYPEKAYEAKYFILPGIGSILLGYLLSHSIWGREAGRFQRNQDAVIVVACQTLAIVIYASPFLLSGNYTSMQAVFKTASVWSTTGLSVVDMEHTSHLFPMYHSTILFLGGIGLVLAMLSVLSNTCGMYLYAAEGHSDHLLPNLLKSARIILMVHLCYILSGVTLYCLFGMPLFSVLIYSIGALSTGGSLSHIQSIGYYDNIWIEMTTIVLVLLGGINFLMHLPLICGKLRSFFQYYEIRFSFFVIILIVPVLGSLLCVGMRTVLPHTLRTALSQVISALAATGSQTVDTFATLPSAALLLSIVLQLIGGSIGLTADGIRQYRTYALCRGIWWNIESQLRCGDMIRSHKINRVGKKEVISPTELSQMGLYTVLYFCLFPLESFILCCYGHPIACSMFEFSSVPGTVGLSTGVMTYDAPSFVLRTGMIGMLIGRLGIYVTLLAAARLGRDIRSHVGRRKTA